MISLCVSPYLQFFILVFSSTILWVHCGCPTSPLLLLLEKTDCLSMLSACSFYLPMFFLCAWQLSLILCGWSNLLQRLLSLGVLTLCQAHGRHVVLLLSLLPLIISSSLIQLLLASSISISFKPLQSNSFMKIVSTSSLKFIPNYMFVQYLIL